MMLCLHDLIFATVPPISIIHCTHIISRVKIRQFIYNMPMYNVICIYNASFASSDIHFHACVVKREREREKKYMKQKILLPFDCQLKFNEVNKHRINVFWPVEKWHTIFNLVPYTPSKKKMEFSFSTQMLCEWKV